MIWQFSLIAPDPLIQTTPSSGTSPNFQENMDFPLPRAFSPKAAAAAVHLLELLIP